MSVELSFLPARDRAVRIDDRGFVDPLVLPGLDTPEGFFAAVAVLGQLNRELTCNGDAPAAVRDTHRRLVLSLLVLGEKLLSKCQDREVEAALSYVKAAHDRFHVVMTEAAADHILDEIFGCHSCP